MKNLNYNIHNEIDEYDLIANSKHNVSRVVLSNLRPSVTAYYDRYLNHFNDIHNMLANDFNVNDSLELKNCYDISTNALNKLKAKIIDNQASVFKFICPYCLIINQTSFDHYIPKEEYPVFSVCAKNLIPCCGRCNGKKLEFWKNGGERAILHFYIDEIPNTQFLFCNISFNNTIPILTFYIIFNDDFDAQLRFRIEEHYRRLELIRRYNEEAPKVLSDIETDINALIGFTPSANDISGFLLNKAIDLKNKYGANYWYSIAYQTLASSQQYLNNIV